MYLSNREEIVVSVILVVVLLVLIDHYVSQEAWLFAVSILTVWPFAEKLYGFICDALDTARESPHPIGFLVYAAAIIGASAAAAYASQQILSPFNLSNSTNVSYPSAGNTNSQPIAFWTVVVVSSVTSLVAYVVSNWSELKEMYDTMSL